MKAWIVIAIIAGLLLVAGIAAVKVVSAGDVVPGQDSATCTSCGNSCTPENNCGLATCGAAQGKPCGCGK